MQQLRNEINDVRIEVNDVRNEVHELRVRVDSLVPKMIAANIASMIGVAGLVLGAVAIG